MVHDVDLIRLPMILGMGTVNCFLVRTAAGFTLIDTGPKQAREALDRALRLHGCAPGSLGLIVLTHGDFDHIGNAAFLRSKFGARIAMHRDDAGMAEQGDMFVNRRKPNIVVRTLLPLVAGFGPAERFAPDLLVDDGFAFDGYGFEARVISLPGHSRGSIGVLMKTGELISGDLFENRKRPTLSSLMDDPAAAQASLASLARLDIGTVYPGHGEPFGFKMLAPTEGTAAL